MRMRTLLLAVGLVLPAFSQTWEPDGTQFRIQRPGPSPRLGDFLLSSIGINSSRLTHRSGSIFFPYGMGMPALRGWQGNDTYLERLEPGGHIERLASPAMLDLGWRNESLRWWKGEAYVLGTRRHPAVDRVPGPSHVPRTRPDLPMELWVSRDFKTWQPLARQSVNFKADNPRLTDILPLENGQFLGVYRSKGRCLSILDRRPDGELVVNRWLEGDDSVIRRSPKGIVAITTRGAARGAYRLLDNVDGHELLRGQLALPRQENARIFATLVRPDGNLLFVSGRYTGGVDVGLQDRINDRSGARPSTQMALALLNAKRWSQEANQMVYAEFKWHILDPATGQLLSISAPVGFPRKVSSEQQALQFRDPQNLEW